MQSAIIKIKLQTMANIIRPTTGLLVTTSYFNNTRKGTFLVADLALHQIVGNGDFSDINSSDNLMGFISFGEAFKYLNETGQNDVNVYCPNINSVKWAEALKCKTKIHDDTIDPLIDETLEILSTNKQFLKVHEWEYQWGSAKQLVADIFWNEKEEAFYNGVTE